MDLVTLVSLFLANAALTQAEYGISQPPVSQVAFEGKRVTFTCEAEGSTFWKLNGSVYSFQNREEMSNNGFLFRDEYRSGPRAVVRKILSVVASSRNNNTNISCVSIGLEAGASNSSLEASLTVIGSPSGVQYDKVNASAFNVSWKGSRYAPDGYEIQNYTVRVINATSGDDPAEVLAVKTVSASPNVERYSIVYSLDEQHLPLTECSWLIFSVTAFNGMSDSLPVNVSWQNPLEFGPITDSKCDQIPQAGRTTLHVQFDLPKQCRFQELQYHIVVSQHGRDEQPIRTTPSTMYNGAESSGSHVEEDIEQLVLENGKVYTASVVVETMSKQTVTTAQICSWTPGPVKLSSVGALIPATAAGSTVSVGSIALLVISIVASVVVTAVSLIILVLTCRMVKKNNHQKQPTNNNEIEKSTESDNKTTDTPM